MLPSKMMAGDFGFMILCVIVHLRLPSALPFLLIQRETGTCGWSCIFHVTGLFPDGWNLRAGNVNDKLSFIRLPIYPHIRDFDHSEARTVKLYCIVPLNARDFPPTEYNCMTD